MCDREHDVTGLWHHVFRSLYGVGVMSGEQKEETWDDVIWAFFDDQFARDFRKYLENRPASDTAAQKLLELIKLNNDNPMPRKWYLDLPTECEKIKDKRENLHRKFSPIEWINKYYSTASHIRFGTHIPKLTHSSIKSSVFIDSTKAVKNSYLSTSNLSIKPSDGNRSAAYSYICSFLLLELNGKELKDEFLKPETGVLKSFAVDDEGKYNDELLKKWNVELRKPIVKQEEAKKQNPTSHFLLKQVYFPVSPDNYHLLTTLVSSSMAHALFRYIKEKENNPASKEGMDLVKFSNEVFVKFPNRAKIAITASHHDNASHLNYLRDGCLDLFSCQPPMWQSKLKPPIGMNSFYDALSNKVSPTVKYLANSLVLFEQKGRSIKAPKPFKRLQICLDQLSDEVIIYVKSVQSLPPGWSNVSGIKLKESHRILLDCYREDEEFNSMRERNDWQEVVVKDFANWLNYQLHRRNNQFTPQEEHTNFWKKLFEANVREVLGL